MKKLLVSVLACTVLLLCVLTSCGKNADLEYTDLGDSYAVSGRGNCKDADVVIPETYNGKPVTSISENAFSPNPFSEAYTKKNYPDLTSVTIPASVTSISAYAFQNCKALTSVTIPEGIKKIEKSTFDNCTALTTITLPSTVTVIAPQAFRGCDSLTTINLDGIAEIGDSAFEGCSALKNFTLSDKATSIGDYAFRDCGSLTELTIPTSVTTLERLIFSGTSENLVVKVCYDKEAPEGWSDTWYESMNGKVLNTSEVWMEEVVAPSLEKAEEIQARIDNYNKLYQEAQEELAALNESSKRAQELGQQSVLKDIRDQMNAIRDSQRGYLNSIEELQEQLDNMHYTNQIN